MLNLSDDELWVRKLLRHGVQMCWWLIPKDNFEMASLPTTSAEERKRLLSFVICGGGPTGVETAAVNYVLSWLLFEKLIFP